MSNGPIATIDLYTLAAVPITLCFDSTKIGTATAFFWLDRGTYFLVTNWHNLSGRHPQTGKHLSEETAAEPNKVEVGMNVANKMGSKVSSPLPLHDADGRPNWWVHPKYGKDVDIAVLPIEPDARFDFYPINELKASPMKFAVGMDVYVIGFPLGPADGFPIWKRASIASEPDMTHDAQRFVMVDTASRAGMSGSPVILRSWGSYQGDAGPGILSGGAHSRFMGIYSGRLATTDKFDAQLGMVWPRALVEEVVHGRYRDSV